MTRKILSPPAVDGQTGSNPSWLRILGFKCRSHNTVDLICQPCVCSDTYAQGYAGTDVAFNDPRHSGHLHPGRY
jgi:hypothetical protein